MFININCAKKITQFSVLTRSCVTYLSWSWFSKAWKNLACDLLQCYWNRKDIPVETSMTISIISYTNLTKRQTCVSWSFPHRCVCKTHTIKSNFLHRKQERRSEWPLLLLSFTKMFTSVFLIGIPGDRVSHIILSVTMIERLLNANSNACATFGCKSDYLLQKGRLTAIMRNYSSAVPD